MNTKTRRKISLLWTAILLVTTIIICAIFYAVAGQEKTSQMLWLDFLIEFGLAVGSFICCYSVPFCFNRSRYPFVTCQPDELYDSFLAKLSSYGWIWLFVFPFLLGITIPTVYLVLLLTSSFNNETTSITSRLVIYFISIILILINNFVFINIIKKLQININNDFETKR
ncbi:hypothetical protein [Spiroplasma sp. DGKH1]|uniref:hypothetical protein n=1 Tax=Spiroplasma sp. DGKH1 TaxID=3050074 RepID=UPI0034C66810